MWGRKKKGDPEGAFTALADHGVGGSGDVSPPVQPSALSMLPPVDHARSPPLKELVRRRLHTDMLSSFKNTNTPDRTPWCTVCACTKGFAKT